MSERTNQACGMSVLYVLACGSPAAPGVGELVEPDLLPAADALVVAPATVNTVNKWAAGIADTLVLGLLVEAYGKGLPIVALPFTNREMAAHPALPRP